jgi:hypothetical protein
MDELIYSTRQRLGHLQQILTSSMDDTRKVMLIGEICEDLAHVIELTLKERHWAAVDAANVSLQANGPRSH